MTIFGQTIKNFVISGIMIDNKYEDSILGTLQGENLLPLLINIMLKKLEPKELNFMIIKDL